LPILLAAAAVAAAVEAASTMVMGLPDTMCASQSETKVLGVAANIGSCVKGTPLLFARTCDRGHNH
jgi:hypothetical protein